MKKIFFCPDSHIPYHDKKAWALMLKAMKMFKPDIINIQGDFADFYAVSSHSKDPNRKRNLEFEVNAVNEALDQLDDLGAKKKIYVSGNHEDRLERYLMDKAPELFNVVKIPDLLNLKKRGWQYVAYKSDTRIGKLYSTHDTGCAGRNAIFRNLDAYQHNVVAGHTHRMAYIVEGNAKGESHVSASFGWLGDVRTVDYMQRVTAARSWTLGFGIGYLLDNGVVHVTPIPIINYGCLIEGKYIKV